MPARAIGGTMYGGEEQQSTSNWFAGSSTGGGKGKKGKGNMMEMMGAMMEMMSTYMEGGASADGDWSQGHAGPKPALSKEKLLIGDWMCPGCGDHQFAKNDACRLCGMARPPQDDANTYGPAKAMGKRSLMETPYTKNLLSNVQPCTAEEADAFLEANSVELVAQQRFLALPPKVQRVVVNRGGLNSARDKTAAFISRMGAVERLVSQGPQKEDNDWICPRCIDVQFGRNSTCRQCGMQNPNPQPEKGLRDELSANSSSRSKNLVLPQSKLPQSKQAMTPGDWFCPSCNDHQFSRNLACRQCGTPKPADAGHATGSMPGLPNISNLSMMQSLAPKRNVEPGDWFCPGCGDHQFSRNASCRKCGTPKPNDAGNDTSNVPGIPGKGIPGKGKGKGSVEPGDWFCPGCGDHQFNRNRACRKCGTPKPHDAAGVANNIAGQASLSQPASQEELLLAQLASQMDGSQQSDMEAQMRMALLVQQLQLQQSQQTQQSQLGGASQPEDMMNQLLVAQMMGLAPQAGNLGLAPQAGSLGALK